jgi:ABC-type antimicrobial peptide transport system permease subunit
MLEQLNFYVRHSLNDLRVNGRRTFFALLCIAAGVAAIVSLQTLAVMIGDTLNRNLQETNRGDVSIEVENSVRASEIEALKKGVEEGILKEDRGLFGARATDYFLTTAGLEVLKEWLRTTYGDQVQITYRLDLTDPGGVFLGAGAGTTATMPETGNDATQLSPILVDPALYPFYGSVKTTDGKPLNEVLREPTDIIFDRKAAETLGIGVGGVVKLKDSAAEFTVRGLVETEVEVVDPFSGIFNALFGFYYLPHEAAAQFEKVEPQVGRVFLRLADPAQATEVKTALVGRFPYLTTTTTEDLRDQNQQISDQVNQLVTVMGLVSLLLGSIGIINTMQVIVRRRTVEVAVLKTLGLQANQITILFLVEAFIMGVIGSILGVLLGWAATFLIRGVAEALVAQPLAFRITPGPVINGVIVGTLVTTIFGFLPTLTAGQVRPAVVLRPNDSSSVPRAGWLRTLLALVVIIVALALVGQTILGSFTTSLGVVIGTFWGAAILLALLLLLIWLIGKFLPTFGIIDLKISLRQMLVGRTRAAITLLALVVGVFSLSLITLLADSVNNLLRQATATASGGNVFVVLAIDTMLPRVEQVLKETPGVSSYNTVRSYSGDLIALEEPDGTTLNRDQLKARLRANSQTRQLVAAFGGPDAQQQQEEIDFEELELRSSLATITARQLDQLPEVSMADGRNLTAADAGKPVMTVADEDTIRAAGITVGDKLTYRFGEGQAAPTITFEVVGVKGRGVITLGPGSALTIPYDSLPPSIRPVTVQVFVNIAPENIKDLRRAVTKIPGAFVLETAILTKLVDALLGTFTAFPTMVALLGLVVGGVVIANSVALTTMERRREIAVMKSIGLQRERVLGMILLENGILGLIGGLIGVGIGLVILVILFTTGGGVGLQAIPLDTALVLMGLCVLIALIAALTTAWGASGEKPLNVLRYE